MSNLTYDLFTLFFFSILFHIVFPFYCFYPFSQIIGAEGSNIDTHVREPNSSPEYFCIMFSTNEIVIPIIFFSYLL